MQCSLGIFLSVVLLTLVALPGASLSAPAQHAVAHAQAR